MMIYDALNLAILDTFLGKIYLIFSRISEVLNELHVFFCFQIIKCFTKKLS